MRHRRFDLATLHVEQIPIVLEVASLVVADQDGASELQWECLAYGREPAPIAQGRYRVDATTLDGRSLGGWAVLVRSIDGAHVLRGDGPLEGIEPEDLT